MLNEEEKMKKRRELREKEEQGAIERAETRKKEEEEEQLQKQLGVKVTVLSFWPGEVSTAVLEIEEKEEKKVEENEKEKPTLKKNAFLNKNKKTTEELNLPGIEEIQESEFSELQQLALEKKQKEEEEKEKEENLSRIKEKKAKEEKEEEEKKAKQFLDLSNPVIEIKKAEEQKPVENISFSNKCLYFLFGSCCYFPSKVERAQKQNQFKQ